MVRILAPNGGLGLASPLANPKMSGFVGLLRHKSGDKLDPPGIQMVNAPNNPNLLPLNQFA
jgi:hypothetical protein